MGAAALFLFLGDTSRCARDISTVCLADLGIVSETVIYFEATAQPPASIKEVQYRPLNMLVNEKRQSTSLRHIGRVIH